jgi:hypothetical protein
LNLILTFTRSSPTPISVISDKRFNFSDIKRCLSWQK